MANKRQANINRNLIAGVPQTIEMGCEFVFIDVGRDLTVIADSKCPLFNIGILLCGHNISRITGAIKECGEGSV